jgi:hypothetical protein
MAGQAFRDLEWEKRVQLFAKKVPLEHSLEENILRMMYVLFVCHVMLLLSCRIRSFLLGGQKYQRKNH